GVKAPSNIKKSPSNKIKKIDERLLQGIYNMNIHLNYLYPEEHFQKEVAFCFLAGALSNEFTTILVLSDSIRKARDFVDAIINTIPPSLIQEFNGSLVKELAKLDLDSKKILYLTNFVKNREFLN
ncbi:hypothetical protein LCGC14_2431260, partial [marine sediment metagenome]